MIASAAAPVRISMVWLGRPPPRLDGDPLLLLAAAAPARDTGSLMGQATDSYRAWDEVLYAGSPPEGWEQDAAGRWWPPGESAGADRRLQANRGLGAFFCVFLIGLQIFLAAEWSADLIGTLFLIWWIGTGIAVGMVMDAKGHGTVWYLAGLAVPPLGVIAAIAMPARVRGGQPSLVAQPAASPSPAPARAAAPRSERRPTGRKIGGLTVREIALVTVGGFAVFGSFAALVLAAAGRFGGDENIAVAGVSTTVAAEAEAQAGDVETTVATAAPATTTTEASSTPTGEESGLPTEDAEVLPFGQMHERAVGFVGAGWNISIDETRAGEPGRFAQSDFDAGCTIVVGTAMLREWEGDELTSNPFSFPSINLIDGDAKVEGDTLNCDLEGPRAEGLVWHLDVSVVEGAEVRWFKVFPTAVAGEYQAVAIEQTIYTPTGN